ncbi:hypothetical protein T08_5103 [Trichinella sp. T8]|nr:hypothetical protein T08_5103 [Trichinella sp. T8]
MTSDRLISTWECEWLRSEAELCHCIWPYASPLAAYGTEELLQEKEASKVKHLSTSRHFVKALERKISSNIP